MIRKIFAKMLPAQIVSNLAMSLCMQVDIVLIGRFMGVDGLAAYGIANPVLMVFTALTGMLSLGVSTVCSGLVGKGDRKGINSNFTSAVVVSLVLGIVSTAVIALALPTLVQILGAEQGSDLFQATGGYLKGYLIGLPAFLVLNALTPYLHIAGKRKLVITSITVMTVLDIVLDILAGKVWLTGMFGMGLATSVSEIGALIVVLFYYLRRDCMYQLKGSRVDFSQIWQIVKSGSSIAVNLLCFTVNIYIWNRLVLRLGGSDAVAVLSIINSLSTLCFTVSTGVAGTTQVLAGIFIGEEDKKNLFLSLKTGILWMVGLNAVICALAIIFAHPLASLFVTDSEHVLDMATTAIRFAITQLLPLGICVIFEDYYPCIKQQKLSIILCALNALFLSSGAALLMSHFFGLTGVWMAKFVCDFTSMLVVGVFTVCKTKKWTLSIENYSLVADNFSISDRQVADYDVRALEDVSGVSEQAGDFCRAHGCDARLSFYMALCIEEMLVDSIIRSFREGKDNLIQVKLLQKEDYWIIRIRDNCENFDPVSYMKLHDTDDDLAHLGVRLVFRLVTEANYFNSLGFNCLTLKLKT